jgi:single-strand DNA-binding protein
MLNRITLIGRLTRDPELKTLSTGKTLVEFSIAVNKRGRDGADFFYVKAWEKTGNYVKEYLEKGRLVAIDGRLETNQYEKDGKQVTSYFITADNVNGLDRPKDDKPSKSKHEQSANDEYDPFADE